MLSFSIKVAQRLLEHFVVLLCGQHNPRNVMDSFVHQGLEVIPKPRGRFARCGDDGKGTGTGLEKHNHGYDYPTPTCVILLILACLQTPNFTQLAPNYYIIADELFQQVSHLSMLTTPVCDSASSVHMIVRTM